MSLKRLLKKVGKVVKKVAPIALPIAATIGTGGAAMPLLGGLAKAGKLAKVIKIGTKVAKFAKPVLAARAAVAPQQIEALQPLQSFAFQQSAQPAAWRQGGVSTMSLMPALIGPLARAAARGLPALRRTLPGIGTAAVSGAAGGLAGGFTTGGGFGGGAGMPRGFHVSRRTGQLVRNRRTNPTNVHALRRALRRVEGFIKIEKRVDKIVARAGRAAGRARRSGFVRAKRSK